MTTNVMIPDVEAVRRLAVQLHRNGQRWTGEAFGLEAQYVPESATPPLDSKMTFTPAYFTLGDADTWFFSLTWEAGRDAMPIEIVDAEGVLV